MSKYISRRDFIGIGTLSFLGLSLPQVLKAEKTFAQSKECKAKNVIFIYLPGGFAHQETFDPKYLAPIEYRGPLGTVRTSTGEYFSEYMKETAKIADKITVIRSMHHGEAAHERGTHNMLTGWKPSPALVYPSMGSVVSLEFGSRNNIPPYIAIPNPSNEGGGAGYLSQMYSAYNVSESGARDLTLPNGINKERFETRKKMREVVDKAFSEIAKTDQANAMESFYGKAYDLIGSEKAQAAFDLNKEPEKLREEYGKNSAGNRMLLARRLVEAGARFVTLTYGGWDHHDNIAANIKSQLPSFDQAYANLIKDLDDRGLLDSTLVVVATEFGRTPKINGTAGRDHWPNVFSVAMAGGGIKEGYIHGSSDATGSLPDNDPLTLNKYAATMYHLIGVDPNKELIASGNRPIRVVDDSTVEYKLLTERL